MFLDKVLSIWVLIFKKNKNATFKIKDDLFFKYIIFQYPANYQKKEYCLFFFFIPRNVVKRVEPQ